MKLAWPKITKKDINHKSNREFAISLVKRMKCESQIHLPRRDMSFSRENLQQRQKSEFQENSKDSSVNIVTRSSSLEKITQWEQQGKQLAIRAKFAKRSPGLDIKNKSLLSQSFIPLAARILQKQEFCIHTFNRSSRKKNNLYGLNMYLNSFRLPVFLYFTNWLFLSFFKLIVTEPIETSMLSLICLEVNHLFLFSFKKL